MNIEIDCAILISEIEIILVFVLRFIWLIAEALTICDIDVYITRAIYEGNVKFISVNMYSISTRRLVYDVLVEYPRIDWGIY